MCLKLIVCENRRGIETVYMFSFSNIKYIVLYTGVETFQRGNIDQKTFQSGMGFNFWRWKQNV